MVLREGAKARLEAETGVITNCADLADGATLKNDKVAVATNWQEAWPDPSLQRASWSTAEV